jgi:hypothetical protein
MRSIGGSVEQYKHPCLVPEIDFAARLLAGTPAAERSVPRDPAPLRSSSGGDGRANSLAESRAAG